MNLARELMTNKAEKKRHAVWKTTRSPAKETWALKFCELQIRLRVLLMARRTETPENYCLMKKNDKERDSYGIRGAR